MLEAVSEASLGVLLTALCEVLFDSLVEALLGLLLAALLEMFFRARRPAKCK